MLSTYQNQQRSACLRCYDPPVAIVSIEIIIKSFKDEGIVGVIDWFDLCFSFVFVSVDSVTRARGTIPNYFQLIIADCRIPKMWNVEKWEKVEVGKVVIDCFDSGSSGLMLVMFQQIRHNTRSILKTNVWKLSFRFCFWRETILNIVNLAHFSEFLLW